MGPGPMRPPPQPASPPDPNIAPDGSSYKNDYNPAGNYDSGTGTGPPAPAAWSVQDPSGHLVVKPDVLSQVADSLEQDINDTQMIVENLQQYQATLKHAVGSWPTAKTFGQMVDHALMNVMKIHNDLLKAHSDVVQKLHTAAAQYSATEAANTATVNSIPTSG